MIARAMPPSSGLVRSSASARHAEADDLAEDRRRRAPSRLPSVSSTTIAAPSPMTRPLRSFENGRQVSVAMTRSASQLFSAPSVMQASVPPVDRRVGDAGAHHLEGEPDGMGRGGARADHAERRPAQADVHRHLARRRVRHQLRNGQRIDARGVVAIEPLVGIRRSWPSRRCRCRRSPPCARTARRRN